VEQVEGVERHAEEGDERVVPTRHEEKRDHVHHGEVAGAVPDKPGNRLQIPRVVDGHDAERHVGREVAEQKDELHPRGECADVEGRAELEFAVVPLAENGRVLHVPLEPRVPLGALGEIPLRVVVEARHCPDIPDQEHGESPGEKDDRNGAQNHEQVVREHLVDNICIR
jgi:hypothetical protein